MAHVHPPCPGCTLGDDHPRHHCVVGDAKASWHLDCHAAAGCPLCQHAITGAEELRGSDRAAQLLDTGAEIAAYAESLDDTTHNQVFGQVS